MEALHKVIGRLSMWLALAGGAVLSLLVVMTCASIAGRSLSVIGLAPIPGDYELVETGIAFSVFSFFPWCQHQGGHARVDLFRRLLGKTGNWAMDVVSNLLALVISFLIAWRLFEGMLDKFDYGETTFILQLPLAWGYAACLPGAFVFVLASLSCLLRTVAQGRPSSGNRAEP
jgi:TRAP-type C4-dicarboxylate transport system permease small subunit